MEDKRDFLFRFIPTEKRKQLQLDEEALYSVTDQYTADKISKDILKKFPKVKIITDATACIGGNTFSFSKFFEKVYALEIDPVRYEFLKQNMEILEVKNTETYFGNLMEVVPNLMQDMVFLDPPWGGPTYKSQKKVDLYLSDIELSFVCTRLIDYTKYIALKVPTNFNIESFEEKTKNVLTLVHKNIELRKMHLYIYERSSSSKSSKSLS
jgi:16S rRNA G966 N2-methylase RsmD